MSEIFKEYNAHPRQIKTSDCVVRAISTALQQDYNKTRNELRALGKQLGSSYRTKKVYNAYLNKHGAILLRTMSKYDKTRCTGAWFANARPKGTYILRMAKHITACINGQIYDTWDCSEKMVYCAWWIPVNSPEPKQKEQQ